MSLVPVSSVSAVVTTEEDMVEREAKVVKEGKVEREEEAIVFPIMSILWCVKLITIGILSTTVDFKIMPGDSVVIPVPGHTTVETTATSDTVPTTSSVALTMDTDTMLVEVVPDTTMDTDTVPVEVVPMVTLHRHRYL